MLRAPDLADSATRQDMSFKDRLQLSCTAMQLKTQEGLLVAVLIQELALTVIYAYYRPGQQIPGPQLPHAPLAADPASQPQATTSVPAQFQDAPEDGSTSTAGAAPGLSSQQGPGPRAPPSMQGGRGRGRGGVGPLPPQEQQMQQPASRVSGSACTHICMLSSMYGPVQIMGVWIVVYSI